MFLQTDQNNIFTKQFDIISTESKHGGLLSADGGLNQIGFSYKKLDQEQIVFPLPCGITVQVGCAVVLTSKFVYEVGQSP